MVPDYSSSQACPGGGLVLLLTRGTGRAGWLQVPDRGVRADRTHRAPGREGGREGREPP